MEVFLTGARLVVCGELLVWYPNETPARIERYGPGTRFNLIKGRVHEYSAGSEGCTYVSGNFV